MLQSFLAASLIMAALAEAEGQSTRPEPLVTGDAVAARPAVTGLKVVNSNWPDPTSLRQFGLDAIRLERAETAEQKAVAIWRWVRRVTMAAANGTPVEPGEKYVSEPAVILNVYGDHHCDGLSRLMAAVYRAATGLPATKLYRAGHTMADCWWVDADGVGRYHMFDVNYGYFLHSRDGGRIVAADDIGMDFSLAAFPSRNARPWLEKQWWMYAWIHCAWPEPVDYDGRMSLRAGEQVLRMWGNIGRPYDDGGLKSGPDPDGGPHTMTYGNGEFRWEEIFRGAWQDKLAVSPANAVVGAGGVGQDKPGSPAELIYRIRTPYVIADVDLELAFSRPGRVQIDTSIDQGRTWLAAWQLVDVKSKQKLSLSAVQPARDGTPGRSGRPSPSRRTPIGRYDALLRIRLDQGAELSLFGCAVIVQHNLLVLPNLLPGDNQITVTGQLAPSQALSVEYVFDDADARNKLHRVRVESLPYSYTIQAAGKRWADVLCRQLKVVAIEADGKGNRVVEAPPAKVLLNGPMPSLDVRVLNGIVPASYVLQPKDEQHRYKVTSDEEVWSANHEPFAPKLKTVAEYVADLASPDEDTRRFAAAGLTVLRDASAWEPLARIAVEDATRAKYYAVQALFWTDAARAWPIMEKILRKDASVTFAPPARDRAEAPTHLNMSAMTAALCGQAKIKAASPLICDVLISGSGDWAEPRWAMLRALGRIGDPSAIPTLRKFTRGGGSDTNVVAIEALAKLGDRESIPTMVSYLTTLGHNIRPEAGLAGLAKMKAQGHVDDIVPLLSSDRLDRRWLAADALAVCSEGDAPKAVAALRAALAKESFSFARERMELAIRRLQAGQPKTAQPE